MLHDTRQKYDHLCTTTTNSSINDQHHLNVGAQHFKIETQMSERTYKNEREIFKKNGNLTIHFSICCTLPSSSICSLAFSLPLTPFALSRLSVHTNVKMRKACMENVVFSVRISSSQHTITTAFYKFNCELYIGLASDLNDMHACMIVNCVVIVVFLAVKGPNKS